MNQPKYSGQRQYEIVVKGHLDEERGYWFEGLAMTTGHSEDGTPITTFKGELVDQAALHGVLAKIRDMNLPLISVCGTDDATQVESNPEHDSQENNE